MNNQEISVALIENTGPNTLLSVLRARLPAATLVEIAVAFVTKAGIDNLLPFILQAARQNQVRLITGLYQCFTEPRALKTLLDAQRQTRNNLSVRLSKDPHFHSKLYLVSDKQRANVNADNSGPLQQAAITNDERFCYYVSDNDVWRIGLDGSGKEKLTNTPSVVKAFGGISRDSSYVLFDIVHSSIQKLDLASRLVTPVLEGERATFFLFGFSRNKDLVAYSAFDAKSQSRRFQFLLARFDGNTISEQKPLVDSPTEQRIPFFKGWKQGLLYAIRKGSHRNKRRRDVGKGSVERKGLENHKLQH